MPTLYTAIPPIHPLSPTTPQQQSPPTSIPLLVYRVHRPSAQTRYAFGTGFSAKNQTTIVNFTSALSRFGLAHLNQRTNISSPFISVYDNQAHAEAVAKHFAAKYGEHTWVVTVDTKHLARGPVFRAADLLEREKEREKEQAEAKKSVVAKDRRRKGSVEMQEHEKAWLHWGEYLVMYRIPAQAIRDQTPVGKSEEQKWRAVGVIGGS